MKNIEKQERDPSENDYDNIFVTILLQDYINFYSIVVLHKSLCPSLDSVTTLTQTIRKFIHKAREYMRAYIEGHTIGCGLETALKQYKSH